MNRKFKQKVLIDTKSSQLKYYKAIDNKKKYNHVGFLEFSDGKQLKTPIIWFGLSVVESVDFQWQVFQKNEIETYLSNVYDLLVQDKSQKRLKFIRKMQQSPKIGNFHKMDSGGFQLMKRKMSGKKLPLDLNPKVVYEHQQKIGCDIAVQLDVPFNPGIKDDTSETIEQTLSNLRELVIINKKNPNPLTIMPVIHGYKKSDLDFFLDKVKEIMGEIQIIGIGSLVPMVKTIKGTNDIGGKWTFIEMLIYLRKKLPNAFIHAFGIGGTMSYLAFYCGIDSLDSNGWIQKAGYGVIQLPGVSDRFPVRKEHGRPYLVEKREYKRNGKKIIKYEKNLFLNCQCPICMEIFDDFEKKKKIKKKKVEVKFQNIREQESKSDLLSYINPEKNPKKRNKIKDKQFETDFWNYKRKKFNKDGSEGRLIRAIHNVYVFKKELDLIREHIEQNTLDKFIEERLITSSYYKFFLYAKYLKMGLTEKANKLRGFDPYKNYRKLDSFLK